MEPGATPNIPGAEEFVAWFGRWPAFHDAEVIDLTLQRAGQSSMRVHVFEMTSELMEGGHFVLRNHAIVTFTFEAVTSMSLSGFNHQNVVSSLVVVAEGTSHTLILGDCYGLAGTISGDGLSMSFQPGTP